MKKRTITITESIRLITLVIFLLPLKDSQFAQTMPVFQYGEYDQNTTCFESLIRAYNNTSVISYYKSGGRGYLAKIDGTSASNNVRPTKLPGLGYQVKDMTVVGDTLFFCGVDQLSHHACLGWMFIPTGVITVCTTNVDGTELTKLVAYKNQADNFKIVALGYSDITQTGYPGIIENNCPANTGMFIQQINNSSYREQFILEMELVGQNNVYLNCDIKTVSDKFHIEDINDIVLMDEHVLFIGVNNTPALTIHQCDKENVLNEFDIFYCFEDQLLTGCMNPVGCRIKQHLIAVAIYSQPSFSNHAEMIYTIDINNKIMSNSQIFYSNDYKVFPKEMVFMDGNQKLTILQDYDFSGTGDVSAFFHIDPYNTLPTYNALCMYKDNPSNKPFVSIDKLPNNNVFVSTGGEYVLTKNVTTYPTGICYSLPTVTMVKSNIIQTKWLEHSFVICTVDFFGELISFPEDPITIMYRCIII